MPQVQGDMKIVINHDHRSRGYPTTQTIKFISKEYDYERSNYAGVCSVSNHDDAGQPTEQGFSSFRKSLTIHLLSISRGPFILKELCTHYMYKFPGDYPYFLLCRPVNHTCLYKRSTTPYLHKTSKDFVVMRIKCIRCLIGVMVFSLTSVSLM